MSAANPDHRKTGIPSTGPLPWGSTFCLFHRTRKDLLDVLVPYFGAGLENNESCLWVTSGILREKDAEKALRKAVADFDARAAAGQVAIVPASRWLARGGRSGKAILSRLDRAIADGFDGVRLACEAVLDRKGTMDLAPCGARVIPGKNVVAAFAYAAGGFDALGIMDVIRHHRFALVRSAGRWETIRSSEALTARAEQRRSDEKLRALFRNMSEGFAYHRILLDPRGKPIDYVFLEINDAFRRLTGLKARAIVGKRATVAIPGLDKDPADWIGTFGKVALTGSPVRFESYSGALKRWYLVSAFSPHKGYFAVTFSDITERKRQEAQLQGASRRFALLADTTAELLTTQEPQQAVESLCRRVMEHLDCQVFFNFLADEKSGRLRLNACAGIPGEEARAIEWLEYGTAVCGCVARDGQRIVAQRIPDTPDPRTELVRSYGVKAYACHPLMGPAGRVLGTLSFGTRTRETFSDEDLSLMRAVTDRVAVAMARMRGEEALRSSLAETEILLKELAHRTKNNMQVIGSLIALQASASADEKLLGALSDTQDRIRAMALVHEKLYRSGNVSSLNMNDYLRDLVSSLLLVHQGSAGPVRPELDLEELRFSIDEALPCGLIINELVSNSLKHAFPGRNPGTVFLSLKRRDGGVELRYRDDGPGLPADLDPARVRSLGLKLVHNLAVRQLRGKMEVRREPVTEFVFAFAGHAHRERA